MKTAEYDEHRLIAVTGTRLDLWTSDRLREE